MPKLRIISAAMTSPATISTRVPARLLRLGAAVAVACAFAVSAVPAAHGAGGNPVLNDCQNNNGTLAGHYTAAQLRHALHVMPSYEKQYSSCYDVISNALAHVNKPTGNAGNSSGGSFLPTPVLIILIVLVLGAGGFAVLAVRSRRG